MGALVQSARGYEVTSDTSWFVAFGSNVVVNNLLVVVIGTYNDTATITTPTDTIGTTYTQAGTLLRSGGSPAVMLAVYYGVAPSSGANTVTVTFSANCGDKELKIFEISGESTSTPLNQTNGATGSSTAPLSGSITTTAAGFIIKAVQEYYWTAHNEAAGTPTTGWTEYGDTATGADSASRNESATGTFNGGFTLNDTSQWACRIVAFADAANLLSPPPVNRPLQRLIAGGM